MRWDTIVAAWLAHIVADSEVRAVLGEPPAVWMAGEREYTVPSLAWHLIADTEAENYETTMVQLDFWVTSSQDLTKLEKALRRLLHHDTPVTLGGVELWSELDGSRPMDGPTQGILGRSLDFRLTYLRGRYVA